MEFFSFNAEGRIFCLPCKFPSLNYIYSNPGGGFETVQSDSQVHVHHYTMLFCTNKEVDAGEVEQVVLDTTARKGREHSDPSPLSPRLLLKTLHMNPQRIRNTLHMEWSGDISYCQGSINK